MSTPVALYVLQFLCNGLEEDMLARWEAAKAAGAEGTAEGSNKEVEAITRASGKMLLLHKLLPKLRSEGKQVCLGSRQRHIGSAADCTLCC